MDKIIIKSNELYQKFLDKSFDLKQFIAKHINIGIDKQTAWRLFNDALKAQRESLFYSENQYDNVGKKDQNLFQSNFDSSQTFDTPRSTKLYDTLFHDFDMSGDTNLIMDIIYMIECTSNNSKK